MARSAVSRGRTSAPARSRAPRTPWPNDDRRAVSIRAAPGVACVPHYDRSLPRASAPRPPRRWPPTELRAGCFPLPAARHLGNTRLAPHGGPAPGREHCGLVHQRRHLRRAHFRPAQRRRASHRDRPPARASSAGSRPPPRAPMRPRTTRNPVRVGLTPTSPITSSPPSQGQRPRPERRRRASPGMERRNDGTTGTIGWLVHDRSLALVQAPSEMQRKQPLRVIARAVRLAIVTATLPVSPRTAGRFDLRGSRPASCK